MKRTSMGKLMIVGLLLLLMLDVSAEPIINFAADQALKIRKVFTVGQVEILDFAKPVSLAHYGANEESLNYVELDKLEPEKDGYRKFIVKAKKPGYGEMTFRSGTDLIKIEIVVQNDYQLLESQLNELFGIHDANLDPEDKIQVIPAAHIGNVSSEARVDAHIYLKGQVASPKDAMLAVAFAANAVGDTGVKIFSNPGGQLRAKDLDSEQAEKTQQAAPSSSNPATATFAEFYESTNKLIDTNNLHRDLVLASNNERVISFIHIKEPDRFSVRVRFLEVDARHLNEFSSSLFATNSGGDVQGAVGSDLLGVPDVSSAPASSASVLTNLLRTSLSPAAITSPGLANAGNLVAGIFNVVDNLNVSASISDLLQEGVLRVVNEFSLITHSGERISLGKGTRFPLPQINNTLGGTQLSVQYIPIGFKGELKVTDLEDGMIDVQLASRLTAAESSNLTFIEGVAVPIFKEEFVNSGAMLRSGQEVVLNSFFTEFETIAKSSSPLGRILPLFGKSRKAEKKRSMLFVALKVEQISPNLNSPDFSLPHVDFSQKKNIYNNYLGDLKVNNKKEEAALDPLSTGATLPGVEI